MIHAIVSAIVMFSATAGGAPVNGFEQDTIALDSGRMVFTLLGHGSLYIDINGRIVHVDPYGAVADYSALPKADLVLITHDHRDHLDPVALAAVITPKTTILISAACSGKVASAVVMKNGDTQAAGAVTVEAVTAYNVVNMRPGGGPFHPKGAGNGYVLSAAGKRVYIAGDTENTPEMKSLRNIDVAFLPMNLPYTMTPEMVADAARAFAPTVLYPYHYGDTDPQRLVELLRDRADIDVRIRRMR